jgi:hypothetical protein
MCREFLFDRGELLPKEGPTDSLIHIPPTFGFFYTIPGIRRKRVLWIDEEELCGRNYRRNSAPFGVFVGNVWLFLEAVNSRREDPK